jgi:hypothetical protein
MEFTEAQIQRINQIIGDLRREVESAFPGLGSVDVNIQFNSGGGSYGIRMTGTTGRFRSMGGPLAELESQDN